MKTILLWDVRFPDRHPALLTLDDTLASACVRAGAAAAANPAEQGVLAAGGALDPAGSVEVVVEVAPVKRVVRVIVPASVAAIGVGLGIMAPVGGPPIPSNPPPVFTTAPSISPGSGDTATTFTMTDGIHNGTSLTRRWLLDEVEIGTGTTIVTGAGKTGSLVAENRIIGSGGTFAIARSAPVLVSAPGQTPIVISGALAPGVLGQPYSSGLTVTPAGAKTKVSAEDAAMLAALGLAWNGNTNKLEGTLA